MSNSEKSADYRDGSDPFEPADEGRAELRAMLDTIAHQMQDADRRHMAALNDMQVKITGLEREADAMRPRVPGQFVPAFEQIELAIEQLAHRLANSESEQQADRGASAQRSDEFHAAPVDPLNPWSQDSADALAGFYDAGEAGSSGGQARPFAGGTRAGGLSQVDEAWLESRFAEIVRGIEYSLAHIKPDAGLSDFGERFDQFERQFGKLFAGVATHDDFTAVRQVETHMEALVNHLEKTQDQLERLNAIEAQLAEVSKTLADLQAAPSTSKPGADIEAVARAVADETAQRFIPKGDEKHTAADELRPLIEQLMTENRQSGEQTVALLDTMQQAMVRLLDRVDSPDFGPTSKAGALQTDYAPAVRSVAGISDGTFEAAGTTPHGQSADTFAQTRPGMYAPDLVLADAMPDSGTAHPAVEETASRSESLRQDLVADARRAKMRLNAEDGDMASSPSASTRLSVTQGAPQLSGSRPIRPTSGPQKNMSGPSAPSPLLMVVAAVVLGTLAGLWYTFGFGNRAEHVGVEQVSPQLLNAAPKATSDMEKPTTPAPSAPAGDTNGTAPDPQTEGRRGDLLPRADRQASAMDTDAPQPRTTLPMLGVAVDLDQPVSQAALEQARRHQAMATMSGELGNAAARPGETAVVPSSMVPTEAETEAGATNGQGDRGDQASAESARSTPLDMPAAMVGPLSLRLAAAKGDPSAQFEVGARFAEGSGVPQNFKEAAKWYQRSADQGFAQAQYRVGTLYERGLGLKTDRAQAADWYMRAAEQGNIKAMHNLAVLSANQSDRAPDYTTAAQWFEEAAKRGLPDSQFNLAILYENGLGVKRDLKQAFLWLSIAARAGDSDATRRRDILRGKLTAQEVADTQKALIAWKLVPTDRTINDALMAGDLWKRNPKNGVSG